MPNAHIYIRIYLLALWCCSLSSTATPNAPELVVQSNLPQATGPVAISPDGKLAAIGNRIWDLESGLRLYDFHPTQIETVICKTQVCKEPEHRYFTAGDGDTSAFSPDGHYFATVPSNCHGLSPAGSVWELKTGKLVSMEWHGTAEGPVRSGAVPFTAQEVCGWSAREPSQPIERAKQLVVRLAGQGKDLRFVVQQISDGKEIWSRPWSSPQLGSQLFTAGNHYLLYEETQAVDGVYRSYVVVQDLRAGVEVTRFASITVGNILFSPKQRWLGMQTAPDTLVLVDGRTFKQVRQYRLGDSSNSSASAESLRFVFSPDESWILDGTGVRHDTTTGESRRALKAGSVAPLTSIAF